MWYRNKYFIFIILVIAVIVIGSTELNTSISDRAIVVGIALDKEANTDKIKLAAQIMTPGGSDSGGSGASSGEDSYSIVKAEGGTINDAIYDINNKIALKFSIAHIGIVILGKPLAQSAEVYEIVLSLLKNQRIKDTTYLICAEDEALKILEEKMAIPSISSTVISKALSKTLGTNKNSSVIACTTVKEFLADYYSGNDFNYMPICKFADTADLYTTALFDKNGVIAELTDEQTRSFNLVNKPFSQGTILFTGNEGISEYEYISKTAKKEFLIKNNIPACTIRLNLKLRCLSGKKYPDGLTEKIEEDIAGVYRLTADLGLDAFGLYQGLYRQFGKDAEKFKDSYLTGIELNIEVKVEVI